LQLVPCIKWGQVSDPMTNNTSCAIMGIINVTPDSFSGDGLVHDDLRATHQAALNQARQMAADGAVWLDVGGESSRPGAEPVPVEEELNRVVPVIGQIRATLGGSVKISVDTVKARVATAALEAGADAINDITAGQSDPAMLGVASAAGCVLMLMHNRARLGHISVDQTVGGQHEPTVYQDVVADVEAELDRLTQQAIDHGVARDKIVIDPGIGFGKTVDDNMRLVNAIPRLRRLGFPVLIGHSRKSFIGHVMQLPPQERLEGTAAVTAISAYLGADIIRVHDVKMMHRIAQMSRALRAVG